MLAPWGLLASAGGLGEAVLEGGDPLAFIAQEEAFAEVMSHLEQGKYPLVARELKRLAAAGHARSQHVLGLFYRNGLGVRKNLKRSNFWLQQSAEQGYPIAMLAFGEANFSGDGVPTNFEQAKAMLTPVASKSWSFGIPVGDFAVARSARARAAYLLGVMLAEGKGGERDDAAAIDFMRQSSNGGDVMASLYLAIEYARGLMVERDLEESKRLFELVDLQAFDSVRRKFQETLVEGMDQAVRQDMMEAAEAMSERFTQMIFASQTEFAKTALVKESKAFDPGLAVNLLRIAADSGYKEAQFLLGYAYGSGLAGEPDYAAACKWLSEASQQGWILADYNLGVLKSLGLGCSKDEEGARTLFDRAAQSGFYVAQLVLDGDRDPLLVSDAQDLALAREAEKQDVRAAYAMAMRRRVGWLTRLETSSGKLFRAFRSGARKGYARAEHMYAEHYYRGYHVKQDFEAAREYFARAAAQGLAQSYFKLGYIYDKGLGVPRDYQLSARWYERAIEFGDDWAANNLGSFYTNGFLGEKNFGKAIELYQKAAEQDNPVAYFNLGDAYQQGKGVEENLEKAVEFYGRAADGGDLEAALELVDLCRRGSAEAIDSGGLAYWLEKVAELGDRRAMKELAERLFRGIDSPRSVLKAAYWIDRYIEQDERGLDLHARMLYAEMLLDEGWSGYDPENAYTLIKSLVKAGLVEARFRYAEIHRKRLVRRANPELAIREYKRLFEEAEKAGDKPNQMAEAAFFLSRMYAEGEGVKQDDVLRARWMKAAADVGLLRAAYLYAGYELNGIGVEQDLASGIARLEELSAKGYDLATVKLGELIAEGVADSSGREDVLTRLGDLARKGDAEAVYLLRRMGLHPSDRERPRSSEEPADAGEREERQYGATSVG